MSENESAEPTQDPSAADADAASRDGTEADDAETETASREAADQEGRNAGAADQESTRAEAVDTGTVEPDEELVRDVSSAEPERVAREIAALRERAHEAESAIVDREDRIAELEDRVEDLESRVKRKQADFRNYKKRMEKRRENERERATEDLVERLLDVRDNLERAVDQDEGEEIRDGVVATLRQFDQVLDHENVDRIEPAPGEEVDPRRHEVLMRVESDQPPGTVAGVHRPGYVMAEKVLRPSQVTVSKDQSDSDDGAESGGGGE